MRGAASSRASSAAGASPTLPMLACARQALRARLGRARRDALRGRPAAEPGAALRRGAARPARAGARPGRAHRRASTRRRSTAAWRPAAMPVVAPARARRATAALPQRERRRRRGGRGGRALGADELRVPLRRPGVLDADGAADPADRRVAPPGRRPAAACCRSSRRAPPRSRAGVRRVRIGAGGTVVHRMSDIDSARAERGDAAVADLPAAPAGARARRRLHRLGRRGHARTSTSSPASRSCSLGHGHPAPVAGARPSRPRVLGHVSNLYWSEPAGARSPSGCATLTGFGRASSSATPAPRPIEAAIKLARRRGRARGGPDEARDRLPRGRLPRPHARRRWRPAGREAKRSRSSRCRPASCTCRATTSTRCAAAVGPQTAAVLVEPVQGEGGVWPLDARSCPPRATLCDAPRRAAAVRRGADRHRPLRRLVRASSASACEPDAVALAKGLGVRPADRRAGGARGRGRLRARRPRHDLRRLAADRRRGAGGARRDRARGPGRERRARSATFLAARLAALPGVADVRGRGPAAGGRARDGAPRPRSPGGCSTRGVLVNAVTPTALRLCPPLCLSRREAAQVVDADLRRARRRSQGRPAMNPAHDPLRSAAARPWTRRRPACCSSAA